MANTLDSASLVTPELMDAEVLSVLRQAVLNGVLEEARAEMAWRIWPIGRRTGSPTKPLALEVHHCQYEAS